MVNSRANNPFRVLIVKLGVTRNSTTTLVAEADLTTQLPVGRYLLQIFLHIKAHATPGFKWSCTVPGHLWAEKSLSSAAVKGTPFPSETLDGLESATTDDTSQVIYHFAFLHVTTPGTFSLDWAQVTSSSEDTTLQSASAVIIWKAQ